MRAAFARARGAWRTAGGVYLAQLAITVAFLIGVERALADAFAAKPYFDRVAAGDLQAFLTTFARKPELFKSILWIGLGLAVVYAIASLWLVAVLIDALAGARASRGKIFLAYLRLWLLAIIPYAVALASLIPVLNRSIDGWLILSVHRGRFFGKLLLGATPGILIFFLTACAVDHARIAIALDPRRRAFRGLALGFKTVLSRRWALPQYVLYLATWLAISLVYVGAATGIESAFLLFVLRQLVAVLRFGARVVTYAGQTAFYSST